MGKPEDAAHGLAHLMGVDPIRLLAPFVDAQDKAIEQEFAEHGSPEDKQNLYHVLAGTKWRAWTSEASLDELMKHQSSIAATLDRSHVLALRLFTTSSYKKINDHLRKQTQPHPFAATTYYISEGIKKLRALAPTTQSTVNYWRGVKDRELSQEFRDNGGTELACLSATTSEEVALSFAISDSDQLPLIFKLTTEVQYSRSYCMVMHRGVLTCSVSVSYVHSRSKLLVAWTSRSSRSTRSRRKCSIHR